MPSRALSLALAVLAAAAGCVMAYHYPLGQPLPIIVFVLIAGLVFFRPWVWPLLLPASLPVIGLAPWSGWISFEELDLLVLAIALGGHAKLVFAPARSAKRHESTTLVVLVGLMVVSLLISMFRGFGDAGGFDFGWYQGYVGPMNSVRIGKSFFLALLLVPLVRQLRGLNERKLARYLGAGLALGLGLASLATVWERVAFTDLMNFSSDYRSTGLFWEMHVGGAALDGWLVLTFPFAIWALRSVKTIARTIPLLILIGIASYACLTTFSRGVYLALAVSLPLLAWLLHCRAKSVGDDMDTSSWAPMQWIFSLVVTTILAALVFPGSGYRGLLALLGLLAIAISIPSAVRSARRSSVVGSSLLGCALGLGLAMMANFIPKGPYFLYALLFVLTLAALYWPALQQGSLGSFVPIAGFLALAMASVGVAVYWGGDKAASGMVVAVVIIVAVLVWASLSGQPLWPNDLRWKGTMLTATIAVSTAVAVFSGGSYMEDRFSTSAKDADGRFNHWKTAISMLQSPLDLAFGKGLGRFPANYYFVIPNGAVPGNYSTASENGNGFLSMTGGGHSISFGDLLRVSQRLNLTAHGPFDLELKVRAKADVTIHAEVCEKHLLYVAQCAIRNAAVKATDGQWQNVKLRLDGPIFNSGWSGTPRLKMFSIGIASEHGAADFDDLYLSEIGGDNLLANPGFSNEMQLWFFSSDRDHMPWHAKNLLVNTLFDQGWFGLAVSMLLLAAALLRLNVGRTSRHELAPYMTASIAGFLVVGMFDSLTDIPRVAFIYYFLLLYAIAFKARAPEKKRASG